MVGATPTTARTHIELAIADSLSNALDSLTRPTVVRILQPTGTALANRLIGVRSTRLPALESIERLVGPQINRAAERGGGGHDLAVEA